MNDIKLRVPQRRGFRLAARDVWLHVQTGERMMLVAYEHDDSKPCTTCGARLGGHVGRGARCRRVVMIRWNGTKRTEFEVPTLEAGRRAARSTGWVRESKRTRRSRYGS